MKRLLAACAAAILLAGCAFPVVNTELPPDWKSKRLHGTGTHFTPSLGQTSAKLMPADEVRDMQRDRAGSREPAPR